ncbi:hypothetical protein V2J09_008531 [Rumex salicifolius]
MDSNPIKEVDLGGVEIAGNYGKNEPNSEDGAQVETAGGAVVPMVAAGDVHALAAAGDGRILVEPPRAQWRWPRLMAAGDDRRSELLHVGESIQWTRWKILACEVPWVPWDTQTLLTLLIGKHDTLELQIQYADVLNFMEPPSDQSHTVPTDMDVVDDVNEDPDVVMDDTVHDAHMSADHVESRDVQMDEQEDDDRDFIESYPPTLTTEDLGIDDHVERHFSIHHSPPLAPEPPTSPAPTPTSALSPSATPVPARIPAPTVDPTPAPASAPTSWQRGGPRRPDLLPSYLTHIAKAIYELTPLDDVVPEALAPRQCRRRTLRRVDEAVDVAGGVAGDQPNDSDRDVVVGSALASASASASALASASTSAPPSSSEPPSASTSDPAPAPDVAPAPPPITGRARRQSTQDLVCL